MVAGFLWERVGKVMGSSWSVEEWQKEWGEAVAGFAGMGMNSNLLKYGGKTGYCCLAYLQNWVKSIYNLTNTNERLARCTAPAALPSPPLPLSLYPPPPVDHRDGIPESEQPPHKRLCLCTLGSKYKVGESSTRGRGVDYGFANTVEAETRH
nr:hypothetical protein [Tanacetum cinerariifolium]